MSQAFGIIPFSAGSGNLPYLPHNHSTYGRLETTSLHSTETVSTSAYDLTLAATAAPIANIPAKENLTIKLDNKNLGVNIKSITTTSVQGLNSNSGKVTIALDGDYATILPMSKQESSKNLKT